MDETGTDLGHKDKYIFVTFLENFRDHDGDAEAWIRGEL